MANEQDPKPAEGAAKQADGDKPAEPKYMTAEDFNKASTAREKRFLSQIQEMLKTQKPAEPKKPEGDVEDDEIVEDDEVAEEPAAKPAAKKPAAAQPSKDAIIAKKALEKVKAVERERKEEKEKAALKEKDLAEREERTATQASLTQAGAVNQKQALAVLKAEGRIKRGDDGELIFVMPRDIAGEKFEEEMPLAEGIKEWLTTDDGKLYAPAKGVEGSGASAQSKQKSLKEMSKADRKKAAGATLLKWAANRG